MTEIAPLEGKAFEALNFATQRFALISSSGGGKSYGCGRIVEDLHDASIPVVVVDTVGIWPAIRLAADGKGPGLPFVVVGGEHADVPFVPAQAGALARFLIGQNASAVVDVSDLMPDERAEPLAVFFETALIEIKSRRRPRFFVLDEAQDLVPERAGKGEARLVRAVSAFVRKSRNHMCGSALLTQRPQDVSKSVLNQVGNLFVGMLFGEHERKAIERWVSSKANSPDAHAQLKRLAELQPGEFFFWSPSWLKLFGKFRFAPKRTFDGSSATPMDPDAVHGKLAPVDVAALRDLLAPPAPKGKASKANGAAYGGAPLPPGGEELGSQTTRLLDELDQARAERDHNFDVSQQIADELDGVRCEITRTLGELQARCIAASKRLRADADELESIAGYAEAGLAVLGTGSPADRATPAAPLPERPSPLAAAVQVRKSRSKDGPRSSDRASPMENAAAKSAPASRAQRSTAASSSDDELDPPIHTLDSYSGSLLTAIKAYGPLTRKQLALVTGVSLISSTFSTSLGKLHAEQWIVTFGGKLQIGDESEVADVPKPRLERGRAVRNFWRTQRLDDYSRKLLDAVFDQRASMTRKELAAAAGVSQISSTFSTTLGRMKRAGIFTYSGGKVALSPEARWAMLA